MGQAKRRREAGVWVVYHHTSSLRTNLLWMSGKIDLEGNSTGVIHPELGEILTDAASRRPMRDFSPLVWFTSRIAVPSCPQQSTVMLIDKATGEIRSIDGPQGASNVIALNRLALGFPVASIPIIPWPEHTGYSTEEGRGLNESARAVGDNPEEWWVSDTPVDLLQMSEIWLSPCINNPKLRRSDRYLIDVKRMVTACRVHPDVYIPPSWMPTSRAVQLAERLGVTAVQSRGGLVQE